MIANSPGAFSLNKPQNLAALLLHVSGQEAASPCSDCGRGLGMWTKCIVAADAATNGYVKGACSNHYYNSQGSKCSLHSIRQPLPPAQAASAAPAATSTAAAVPASGPLPVSAGPDIVELTRHYEALSEPKLAGAQADLLVRLSVVTLVR